MSKIAPQRLYSKGKRGNYTLMFGDTVIGKFSNLERLRGVQYFLEANPTYAAAPELLGHLESAIDGLQWLMDNKPKMIDESDHEKIAEWRAAIAKATGGQP